MQTSYTLPYLQQPTAGYRYNIDSLLLLRFAQFHEHERVVDLGAGVGVLALIALQRFNLREAVAIEIQEELSAYAEQNALALGLGERFQVLRRDWRTIEGTLARQSFHVALSNPPYRALGSGKIPPNPSKTIARYETHGDLKSLLEASFYLLKKSGRLYLIYPPVRLEELSLALTARGFKMQRLQMIHSYLESPAHLMMVEAVLAPRRELKVEAPLILYSDSEHYTPEIEAWVGPKRKI